jgi:hypothetical protein
MRVLPLPQKEVCESSLNALGSQIEMATDDEGATGQAGAGDPCRRLHRC